MTGIIDYGMGNLLSVQNALDYLGEDSIVCSQPSELRTVERIILPGVGAFPDCMLNLNNRGFVEILNEEVLVKQKPILGICLGMQIMAKVGYEKEETAGLGWFNSEVVYIEPEDNTCKVPNVGWQDVFYHSGTPLFVQFPSKPDFYFVHSYHMICNDLSDVTAFYCYGKVKITAAIQRKNIFGTQFHPEKSSDFGRQLLINFLGYHG